MPTRSSSSNWARPRPTTPSSRKPRRRSTNCAPRPPSVSSKACCRARPTAMIAISKSTPAAAAPCPGTGPRCCSQDRLCPLGRAHDYKAEWVEESAGEGADIKSANRAGQGRQRPGWRSKTESGVPRLKNTVSPFHSTARAAAPDLASAWVSPVIDDKIEIDIQDKYLRVDTLPRLRRRRATRQQNRQRGALDL